MTVARPQDGILIGWAATDLTPDGPVIITGQMHARVSEGVRDPLSATAMAFESYRNGEPADNGVMVSCDLVCISDSLRDAVREHVRAELPELDPQNVFLNATHTHTGPEIRTAEEAKQSGGGIVPHRFGVELDVMSADTYVAFAARRIADAIAEAWRDREPAGVGFGLGHATVGYNRRICYYNGETRMYGNPDDPEFSHVEAGADSSVNVLFTWNRAGTLTGAVVNLTCPSQTSEHEFQISADYWHETRQELRRRLGDALFILPQASATGDIVPGRRTTMMDWTAQERMWRLMGIDQRRDIGQRIAHAVTSVLPYAQRDIDWNPPVSHCVETVELTRRRISEQDVKDATAEADKYQAEFDELSRELEADPSKRQAHRWYVPITRAFRLAHWNRSVAVRYQSQQAEPTLAVELHVVRLGEVAIATNPFEYYLDFGHQIKARSKAVQTFLVQLTGPGTYLPTRRAVAGKSYGALPASTLVGPEGGRELANWTIDAIGALWAEDPRERVDRVAAV